MIDFVTETDPEVLRQVAKLQHSELLRRNAIIKHLQQRLLAFEGNADKLQIEMLKLQEKLAAREHALFGASSERRVDWGDRIHACEVKGGVFPPAHDQNVGLVDVRAAIEGGIGRRVCDRL